MKVRLAWVAVALWGGVVGCQKEAGEVAEVVSLSADVGAGSAPQDSETQTDISAAVDAGVPGDGSALGDGGASSDTSEAATGDGLNDAASGGMQLREKLLALATTSECLRKNGVPPEESARQMDSFYMALAIPLETYTKEMSRFAADPAFLTELEAKIAACPIDPVKLADAVIASTDTTGADTLSTDTTTPPDTVQAAEVQALTDSTVSADTQVVGDVGPVLDVQVTAADATADVADVKPRAALSGTWTGAMSGKVSGSLRVVIVGRSLTSATATFGRVSLKLKGSLGAGGSLTLGGTSRDDFLRVSGQLDKSEKFINGSWDGVVDRKRGSGKFRLAR